MLPSPLSLNMFLSETKSLRPPATPWGYTGMEPTASWNDSHLACCSVGHISQVFRWESTLREPDTAWGWCASHGLTRQTEENFSWKWTFAWNFQSVNHSTLVKSVLFENAMWEIFDIWNFYFPPQQSKKKKLLKMITPRFGSVLSLHGVWGWSDLNANGSHGTAWYCELFYF